jgi:hypothetical protein
MTDVNPSAAAAEADPRGAQLGHVTKISVPTSIGLKTKLVWTPREKVDSDKAKVFYSAPDYDYPEIMVDSGYDRWFECLGFDTDEVELTGSINVLETPTPDVRRDDPTIDVIIDNPMKTPKKVVWIKSEP